MKPLGPATAFTIALAGIATYCLMDVFMKRLSLSSGVFDAMLWRCVLSVVIVSVPYLSASGPRPSGAALRLHAVRGTVNLIMALLYFWGLARIPIAQAIALAFIAPLVTLLLAALFLKERIGKRIVVASLIAFSGVLVIVGGQAAAGPSPDIFRGVCAILVSALCYAWNIILMRQQALVAKPLEIVFFQNLMISALMLPLAPFFGSLPGADHALDVIGAATLALVSALMLARAYGQAEASYLVATEYSGFLWGALFGFLFFGEHVSPWTTAGAALIIAGCVVAARSKPSLPAPGELP